MWGKSKAASSQDEAVTGVDPQAAQPGVKSKEERLFLLKLDIFLLTFACLSQVIKYLDQNNISVAYVSGMSEDLNLTGNQLNYFTTWFNVGYCLFVIPSQTMVTWFRPSIWLPALELVWGGLTGAIAGCKDYKSIYVIRAFIGVAESSCYPGAVTLLMTWYTPTEMAKRIGFYHSCQAMGGLMSSAMQSAIAGTLDGSGGIAGWRWTFIINCIMTIVMAFAGPFVIPDFPNRPNRWAFWLTKRDKEIALERLSRVHRMSPNPISLNTAKRAFSNPMTYMMIWIYTGQLIACSGSSYFSLFLKSLKHADGTKVWTTAMLNAIPLGGYAMQIGAVWFFAFASDFFRTRWLMLLSQCVIGIPPAIIMSVWNVPVGAKYFSYFAQYLINAGGPPLWAWMSDMLPQDAEQRALILGICITSYYAINAWANVLIWPATQAPHYKYGWEVSLCLWVTCGIIIGALRVYDVKVIRPRNYRLAQIAAEEIDAFQTQVPVVDGEDDAKDPLGSKTAISSVRVREV